MSKFLLDANLSPETKIFLEKEFRFDVVSLLILNLGQLPDEKVVKIAQDQKRVIVTFDQDFGEMFYFKEAGNFGVIILKLENQTIESVNLTLKNFFNHHVDINLENSLIIVEENKIRITR